MIIRKQEPMEAESQDSQPGTSQKLELHERVLVRQSSRRPEGSSIAIAPSAKDGRSRKQQPPRKPERNSSNDEALSRGRASRKLPENSVPCGDSPVTRPKTQGLVDATEIFACSLSQESMLHPSIVSSAPATFPPARSMQSLIQVEDTRKAISEADTPPYLLSTLAKMGSVLLCWYMFLVSLDLMSLAFRLFAGRPAGNAVVHSEVIKNPVVGVLMGLLLTVLVQSSSSSTSIAVTLVGSQLLTVHDAIPIVMGANLGTSVTSSVMALATRREEPFRPAFAAAAVHQLFNWLTVLLIMPFELSFAFLEWSSKLAVQALDRNHRLKRYDHVRALTRPLTNYIVQLENVGPQDDSDAASVNMSTIRTCCATNGSKCVQECRSAFTTFRMGDQLSGLVLLFLAFLLLLGCLTAMARILGTATRFQLLLAITKFSPASQQASERDTCCGRLCLEGYICLCLGLLMTMLLHSSSALSCMVTSLASGNPSAGGLDLQQVVYPLTLGANVGTTTTGILAALAGDSAQRSDALQLALCHTFLNVYGVLLFYPVPFMRFPVILAHKLANTAAKYRWFPLAYLLLLFISLPCVVLFMSFAGTPLFNVLSVPFLVAIVLLIALHFIQRLSPTWLPAWLRSLAPLDRIVEGRLLQRCPLLDAVLKGSI
ncbi:sodium-dependent phosphate transport protein 2C-like [Ornithodoros turicata]|uniref:sodium-dependent phosphate transport protein 2C-like n=1 Tax=Ornithodoros turicata TaxID=34597 RepID=UPI003138E362